MPKLKNVGLLRAGLVIAAMAIANVPGATVHAQQPKPRANFSGTWVFDADATQSAATAQRPGSNIFGESFVARQDANSLTLDITIAAGLPPVKATYGLDGKETKNASPPPAPGAAPIVVTATAKWDDDMLIVESKSQQPGSRGAPAVVDIVSTRKMWLSNGRLVIDRDGTPKNLVPSTRSVYSRK